MTISLGTFCAEGRFTIARDMVSAYQELNGDGTADLKIEFHNIGNVPIPDKAVVSVVIKDNQAFVRDRLDMGRLMGRECLTVPLRHALSASSTDVIVQFADPDTSRLFAATNPMRLPKDDQGKDEPERESSSQSVIRFLIDRTEILPFVVRIGGDGPTIVLGKLSPSSIKSSRSDFGWMAYAITGAMTQIFCVLLTDGDRVLDGRNWEYLRAKGAVWGSYGDWQEAVESSESVTNKATRIMRGFYERGLQKEVEHLHKRLQEQALPNT